MRLLLDACGGSAHRAGGVFSAVSGVRTDGRVAESQQDSAQLCGSFLGGELPCHVVGIVVLHGVKSVQFSGYIFEMLMIFVASTTACWLAARVFLA